MENLIVSCTTQIDRYSLSSVQEASDLLTEGIERRVKRAIAGKGETGYRWEIISVSDSTLVIPNQDPSKPAASFLTRTVVVGLLASN